MSRVRQACRSGMVTLALLAGGGALWLLQCPRLWDMVECAAAMRFRILNPQHWLQLLILVN